jgi:hypothetical protein
VRASRGMIMWTMKCLKTVGVFALVTVVLALAFAVGTGITALSQWDDPGQISTSSSEASTDRADTLPLLAVRSRLSLRRARETKGVTDRAADHVSFPCTEPLVAAHQVESVNAIAAAAQRASRVMRQCAPASENSRRRPRSGRASGLARSTRITEHGSGIEARVSPASTTS